jgi:hypothetical protein
MQEAEWRQSMAMTECRPVAPVPVPLEDDVSGRSLRAFVKFTGQPGE